MSLSATAYAAKLLQLLDHPHDVEATSDPPPLSWRRSGLFAITGQGDGAPLVCPAPLASAADGTIIALRRLADKSGIPANGSVMLGERARLLNLRRRGSRSANGTCAILPCRDGHVALNRARPEDDPLIAIALQLEGPLGWDSIAASVTGLDREAIMERFQDLGLPVSTDRALSPASPFSISPGGPAREVPHPLVLDFSALWAGPLAASILAHLGAQVCKVESHDRPDGARCGNAQFHDLLNGGKASLRFDFHSADDRALLLQLVRKADIVIESSRPRALAQLGIDRMAEVDRGCVWISITGHDDPDRVGFGDDAAVEGGLATVMERGWGEAIFAGDAIADPLTGLHAALAAWSGWMHRKGQLVSLSLSRTVAFVTANGVATGEELVEWQDMAMRDQSDLYPLRSVSSKARPSGADNRLLADLLAR